MEKTNVYILITDSVPARAGRKPVPISPTASLRNIFGLIWLSQLNISDLYIFIFVNTTKERPDPHINHAFIAVKSLYITPYIKLSFCHFFFYTLLSLKNDFYSHLSIPQLTACEISCINYLFACAIRACIYARVMNVILGELCV